MECCCSYRKNEELFGAFKYDLITTCAVSIQWAVLTCFDMLMIKIKTARRKLTFISHMSFVIASRRAVPAMTNDKCNMANEKRN